MGVTTQLFENSSGARYLSATLGQSLYLTQPRGHPARTRALQPPHTTSSLIAEVNLTAYRHWNLQVDVGSNPAVSGVEQAEVLVQYLANSKQVVNVGYLYRDGGGAAGRRFRGLAGQRITGTSTRAPYIRCCDRRPDREFCRLSVPRHLLEHPRGGAEFGQHPHRRARHRRVAAAGTHRPVQCRKWDRHRKWGQYFP